MKKLYTSRSKKGKPVTTILLVAAGILFIPFSKDGNGKLMNLYRLITESWAP